MKISTKLSLSFVLLFFLVSFSASQDADPVLDITGKPLQTGVNYYILPVIRGSGGGLTLDSINNTCPLDVVQAKQEVDNGLPLTFTPVNPNEGVIRVSTDLNIKFSAASICVQTTLWQLGGFDESIRRFFVTTGGVEGNPGPETLSNWFKIEKYERDYKLVFCPGVCDFCRPVCGDLSIFVQDGLRHLALSLEGDNAPFAVMFKKASGLKLYSYYT